MKHPRPKSYQIGQCTVRQDAGLSRTWRVFIDGTLVFSTESQTQAFEYARAREVP